MVDVVSITSGETKYTAFTCPECGQTVSLMNKYKSQEEEVATEYAVLTLLRTTCSQHKDRLVV